MTTEQTQKFKVEMSVIVPPSETEMIREGVAAAVNLCLRTATEARTYAALLRVNGTDYLREMSELYDQIASGWERHARVIAKGTDMSVRISSTPEPHAEEATHDDRGEDAGSTATRHRDS